MMNLNADLGFRSLLAYTAKHDPQWQEQNALALEAMQQFPFTRNTWLHGRVGSGKTRIAKAAGMRHQSRWESALRHAGDYPQAYTLCEVLRGPQLRAIATQLPSDREEDIYKFARPNMLIVDDIDKVDLSNEKPLETLYEILDFRQRAKRLTIVTSNFSIRAMAEHWGRHCRQNATLPASILDRLRPCREFHIQAARSLRGREAIPAPQMPEPVELVSPAEAEQARNILRDMQRKGAA